jgi:hypothetical protein
MSSHQALSRHGFALLRRAVEANPVEFSPFLLEKLRDGHFFSHASIDTLNCSQLVNACRIMMTSAAASTEMIQHALTVIFNLLKSPRCVQCRLIHCIASLCVCVCVCVCVFHCYN